VKKTKNVSTPTKKDLQKYKTVQMEVILPIFKIPFSQTSPTADRPTLYTGYVDKSVTGDGYSVLLRSEELKPRSSFEDKSPKRDSFGEFDSPPKRSPPPKVVVTPPGATRSVSNITESI
jgi:hypothetical protein